MPKRRRSATRPTGPAPSKRESGSHFVQKRARGAAPPGGGVADGAIGPDGSERSKDRAARGKSPRMSCINDEWQTASESWAVVAPLLRVYRKRRVWMPFYYDGQCAEHLRALGFRDVVHRREDFFDRVQDSKFMAKVGLIWDNPPYTGPQLKERVLRALADSGKPFVMLLPSSVLHSKLLQDVFDTRRVQVIYPRRVFVRKTGKDKVPFKYLVWLCYKLDCLDRDVVFL